MKWGGSRVNGVLNVLKPPGMTAHDVVNYLRRVTGQRKTGHAGTLDPGAAGVLTLYMGQATRIIEYMPDDKVYRAEITFGLTTDTQDIQGRLTGQKNASNLTLEQFNTMAREFVGAVQQVPPMVSAVHHQGQRLYELARRGLEVERQPRRITVYSLELLHNWDWGKPHPRVMVEISCSAGTYIRTICSDLGERLGVGAIMSFLLRTRAGRFGLDQALTLEELTGLNGQGRLADVLVSVSNALDHLPMVWVSEGAVRAVKHGNRLYQPGVASVQGDLKSHSHVRLAGPEGLLAVASNLTGPENSDKMIFQPVKVLV